MAKKGQPATQYSEGVRLLVLVLGTTLLAYAVRVEVNAVLITSLWVAVHLFWLQRHSASWLQQSATGDRGRSGWMVVVRWLSLGAGLYLMLLNDLVAPLEMLLAVGAVYTGFALSFLIWPTGKTQD